MGENGKKGFYDEVNPEDVESILTKSGEEKLPRRKIEEAVSKETEPSSAETKKEELQHEAVEEAVSKETEPSSAETGEEELQHEAVEEAVSKETEPSSAETNEKELKHESTEEIIPPEVEKREEKIDSMNTISKDYVPTVFKRGDTISATVVKIEPTGVMVNAGGKVDYFIPMKGLSAEPITSPEEVVKVGDKINVYVIKTRDAKGGVILSKKRADYVGEWDELSNAFTENKSIKIKVVKAIKGGLLVDVSGIVGFLPQSHVGLKRGENLETFVGKEMEAKILEINPTIRRIIVSCKEVLRKEREKEKKEALVNLKKGEVISGIVRTIKDFGIFVDIGHGIDGFVRLNELTWGRRKPPKEVVRLGKEVKVKILSINLDTGKVALSLRQTKPYPWDVVEEKFPEGSIAEGTVIRIHPFGAVVELAEGITGLIHISQLDKTRVNKVEDIVKLGEQIKIKVLSIDKEKRKMRLSRKAALEDDDGEKENTI
ncbi:MAG: S1 RNA-binding domain-containing protein [Caldisericota bacterium]|nr:S1 RNA-binding domain-containing protein [Caldisericota bacterium]